MKRSSISIKSILILTLISFSTQAFADSAGLYLAKGETEFKDTKKEAKPVKKKVGVSALLKKAANKLEALEKTRAENAEKRKAESAKRDAEKKAIEKVSARQTERLRAQQAAERNLTLNELAEGKSRLKAEFINSLMNRSGLLDQFNKLTAESRKAVLDRLFSGRNIQNLDKLKLNSTGVNTLVDKLFENGKYRALTGDRANILLTTDVQVKKGNSAFAKRAQLAWVGHVGRNVPIIAAAIDGNPARLAKMPNSLRAMLKGALIVPDMVGTDYVSRDKKGKPFLADPLDGGKAPKAGSTVEAAALLEAAELKHNNKDLARNKAVLRAAKVKAFKAKRAR